MITQNARQKSLFRQVVSCFLVVCMMLGFAVPLTSFTAAAAATNDAVYPFSVDGSIICSTNKVASSTSTYTYTVHVSGTYHLKYKVSSENNYDWLTIEQNGTRFVRVSGERDWNTVEITVSEGDVITVKYSKDSSQNRGSDCGWVDFGELDAACDHVYDAGTVIEPTCVERGYTLYTCTLCGAQDMQAYTDVVAHQYESGYCVVCGKSESSPSCDIVFLIDITGSMSEEIANVKNSIVSFSEQVESYDIDLQMALVTYSDITSMHNGSYEYTEVCMNGDSEWWTDAVAFRDRINSIALGNGGDNEECTVDGLEASRRLTWREYAAKFIVVVTDNMYKVDNQYGIGSMGEMIELLQDDGVITSVASPTSFYSAYQPLVDATQGVLMNINNDFSSEMLQLIDKIYETTRITKITVKRYPNKTTYFEGEYLDTTGLTITVHFSDGTTQDLTSGFDCYPDEQLTLGDTVITIVYNGFHETIPLTVTENIVNVTGITIDRNELSLQVGESAVLHATVTPGDATNKNITWYSDNERVATVSGGTVVAVGDGTTTVRAISVDGSYTATCTVTVSSHTHSYVTQIVEATCTEAGESKDVCSDCGDEINVHYIPALGHNYVSEVTEEATCEHDGTVTYTCTNDGCGHSYQIPIHIEHDYDLQVIEPTCTVDGASVYTCTLCGHVNAVVIPAAHDYQAEITKHPTRDEDGEITYTCSVCGDFYTEVIPASNANVLVIQDRIPWDVNNIPVLLNDMKDKGYIDGWSMTTTASVEGVDLSAFDVILIANDQTTATYNQLQTLDSMIIDFVTGGGTVIYGACDNGWAGGDITFDILGTVQKTEFYSMHNYIVDTTHPIVTGALTDDKAITNELLLGTYCSHSGFVASTLPAGYNTILQDGQGNATLVEYPLGEGRVILSGLTWEFYYSRIYTGYTSYSMNVFDDLIVYAISSESTCTHAYDAGTVVEATCLTQGYTIHTCSMCGATYKDSYVPALGHAMGEWTVVREPNCVTTGLQHQTCSRCDETIEAVIPTVEHTLGDWIVDVEPTAMQPGHRHKECIMCGTRLVEEVLPVLAKLVIENVVAEAGSTVRVTINVQNNPGIIGAVLTIAYDPALTLIQAEAGGAWNSLAFTKPSVFSNPCNFVWDGVADADYGNGTILILTFEVPDAAAGGTVYSIRASYTPDNMINADLEPMDLEVENGSVTVTNLIGDVDDNGVVDVADVITLRRYLAGGYGVEIDEEAADMNDDGVITIADVVLLRRFLVE